MKAIEGLLQDIGLTDSEIKTYLALLELGSSTTGPIVEKAKVSSSKIYEILEKLIQKGLASYIIKKGTKHFEAAEPKRILDYLKEKENKLKQQEKEIEKILPELEIKKQLSKYKSEAQIYKGMKGVETAFYESLDLLDKGDDYLAMGIPEQNDTLNRFFIKFGKERVKRGIGFKGIFNDTPETRAQAKKELSLNSEIKFMPEITPAAVDIFKDRVIIFAQSKELLIIVIDNKETADSFRVQFDALWNQDVKVIKGFEAVTKKFRGMLDEMKPGEEYQVYGATYGKNKDKLHHWFKKYHGERAKLGIKAKLLCNHDNFYEVKKEQWGNNLPAELKKMPFKYESPIQVNLYPNKKVLMFLFDEDFTCFEIDSDVVYDSFKEQFDTHWNQKVRVYQGVEEVKGFFEESMNWGDYCSIAEGMKIVDLLGEEFFEHWQTEKKKKGINAKVIMGSRYKGQPTHSLSTSKFKFIPDFENPGATLIFKDRVAIMNLTGEPNAILIQDPEAAKVQQKYFNDFWNRDTFTVKGLDAIKDIFNFMLDEGHVDLIGARGYFMDKTPEFTEKWKERGIKQGFTMRNIVDPETKGHYITKLPFAETKYTLQKEFAEMSVIWVSKNRVAISNWTKDEPTAIIIENKEIIKTYQKQFESLWNK